MPAVIAHLLEPQGSELYARFAANFKAVVADNPVLIGHAQALRFQVYCLERRFEEASCYPDRLEHDEYDLHAIQSLLLFGKEAEPIGTCRLIPCQPNGVKLPFQNILESGTVHPEDYLPLATTAEVSRFLISKSYRLRVSSEDKETIRASRSADLFTSLPCLGLVQALLRSSVRAGITHWAAVMEPKLLRMLASLGIHFHSIGSLVSHHGLRQPSYCALEEMLTRLYLERPDHWEIVTDGGRLALRGAGR